MRFTLITLFLFVLILLPDAFGEKISKHLRRELSRADSRQKISVILTFQEDVAGKSLGFRKNKSEFIAAKRLRGVENRNRLKSLLRGADTHGAKDLWLTNSISVSLSSEVIEALAESEFIESVRSDVKIKSATYTTHSIVPDEWNIDAINVRPVWDDGVEGQGVVVAVMDTGVDVRHPDLADKYRGGDNSWYDTTGEYLTPDDTDGHGTNVAGIILGGDESGVSIGVAPQAQWIAVKIFDSFGEATYSDIHLGFQWLIDPDNDPNTDDYPDIVNGSWGLSDNIDDCDEEFYDDIEAFKALGILVVFSAGNSGPLSSTSISPANYEISLAVGSVDSDLTVSTSSSRGPSPCNEDVFPQIVAPGQYIYTCDITQGGAFLNAYTTSFGTSLSAPHISGALALLLSAFPQNSSQTIEEAIKDAAMDLGTVGPDYYYGYGMVDVNATYEHLYFLAADFDGDGVLGYGDFAIFLSEWLNQDCEAPECNCDLNYDEIVNLIDYSRFTSLY